ncbi:DUF5694 domain-containing protein [Ureibacillus acetophenoni]|uniref:TraB family protein n=1 Tax=Ureibacillus acetophenoni TaxID=614649 RepID=A0A285UPR3_9BACL|nr:DUF5694 domain-containing protein [Ureibacillus acetophenoni]SOC43895.1 hypothetical protein SAMN05877842_11793 [Ureibacillus acetophenoni]
MKPKVLIVGTFHFGGSADYIQVETDNLLSEKRQGEIIEVVGRLAKFNPTKIAVEYVKENEEALNEEYQNFLKGTYELKVNEIDQIGFRLAKEMGHQKVHSIDWMGDVGSRSIDEVMDWAKDNQIELYKLITENYIPQLLTDFNGPLIETLKKLNQKERMLADHRLYMNLARIGEGTDYVGIDWLRWWYQRNLIIYHNLLKLIDKTDERILLIIGTGHLYLVRQFLAESGLVEIEEVENYLDSK